MIANLPQMKLHCKMGRLVSHRPEKGAAETVTIGWTPNVVILEAELTLQKKAWYIQAVQRFGWSRLELIRQITSAVA